MAAKRSQQELNILRQAILDHCHEPMSAKDLEPILGEAYQMLNGIMDTLAEYEFLSVTFTNETSGIGRRRKYFKTEQPIYTPIPHKHNIDYLSKGKNEPLSPGGRRPDWNSEYFKDKLKLQSEDYRKNRKSARTYVGISQVYNG